MAKKKKQNREKTYTEEYLEANYFLPGKLYRFDITTSHKYFADLKDNVPTIADEYINGKDRIHAASKCGKFTVNKKREMITIRDPKGFPWTIFREECIQC